MPSLSRDQIRSIDDIVTERVDVPEWGGYVNVRAMTGAERNAMDAHLAEQRADGRVSFNIAGIRMHMVLACCVDDDGHKTFSEDDAPWLETKSAGALERVAAAAMRLSGMLPESKGKAVENFTPTLNGVLSSG